MFSAAANSYSLYQQYLQHHAQMSQWLMQVHQNAWAPHHCVHIYCVHNHCVPNHCARCSRPVHKCHAYQPIPTRYYSAVNSRRGGHWRESLAPARHMYREEAAEDSSEESEDSSEESEDSSEESEDSSEEAEVSSDGAEVSSDGAEVSSDGAEDSREEAEDSREEAEDSREEAEDSREEAEIWREEAEVWREEAEVWREVAEVSREEAEDSRKESKDSSDKEDTSDEDWQESSESSDSVVDHNQWHFVRDDYGNITHRPGRQPTPTPYADHQRELADRLRWYGKGAETIITLEARMGAEFDLIQDTLSPTLWPDKPICK